MSDLNVMPLAKLRAEASQAQAAELGRLFGVLRSWVAARFGAKPVQKHS